MVAAAPNCSCMADLYVMDEQTHVIVLKIVGSRFFYLFLVYLTRFSVAQLALKDKVINK
jgi:hypothetical protein